MNYRSLFFLVPLALAGCLEKTPEIDVSYEVRHSNDGRFKFGYIRILSRQSVPLEIQNVILNERFYPTYLCSTDNRPSIVFPDDFVKPLLDEAFAVLNGEPSYQRVDNGPRDQTHYFFRTFEVSGEKRKELGRRVIGSRANRMGGYNCPALYFNDTLKMGDYREFGIGDFATKDSTPKWFGNGEPVAVTVETDQGSVSVELQ